MTKHIEFKNASGLHIAEVIANKGICWQVRDDAGDEYPVPKKQVTRGPWEETEEDEIDANELADNAAAHPVLGAMLGAMLKDPAPEPKAKKEKAAPAERDPNLVSLKELCFELNVIPRIARRKLRKAVGHVGTGGRWEWTLGSEDLAKVRAALVADPHLEAADQQDADPVADALKTLGMTQEDLDAGLASAAEQGAAAAAAE